MGLFLNPTTYEQARLEAQRAQEIYRTLAIKRIKGAKFKKRAQKVRDCMQGIAVWERLMAEKAQLTKENRQLKIERAALMAAIALKLERAKGAPELAHPPTYSLPGQT